MGLGFDANLVTIWLRYGYDTVAIWLHFGYAFIDMVTFWLRNLPFWLRFGYARMSPGINLVTQRFLSKNKQKYVTVIYFCVLQAFSFYAHLPSATKNFGYVYQGKDFHAGWPAGPTRPNPVNGLPRPLV